jgi:hypothetical protein
VARSPCGAAGSFCLLSPFCLSPLCYDGPAGGVGVTGGGGVGVGPSGLVVPGAGGAGVGPGGPPVVAGAGGTGVGPGGPDGGVLDPYPPPSSRVRTCVFARFRSNAFCCSGVSVARMSWRCWSRSARSWARDAESKDPPERDSMIWRMAARLSSESARSESRCVSASGIPRSARPSARMLVGGAVWYPPMRCPPSGDGGGAAESCA